MTKILIIGGGLAGLSSAVFLSKAGYEVEVIEASPNLGGRTRSFVDEISDTEIDNGQHILMGAYKATFEYLKLIKSENLLTYQNSLEVNFINSSQQIFSLKSPNKFYPMNLIRALLNYNALNLREKLHVFRFLINLFFKSSDEESDLNVYEYLKNKKQTENIIKSLWEIIGVGALNTSLHEASVKTFDNLLKKIFFTDNLSSTLIIPEAPLSEIFVNPAVRYFNKNGINFSLSEKVIKFECETNSVKKVITTNREISDFTKLVLAIPPYAIKKINSSIPITDQNIEHMTYSPIITIHLWEHENTFKHKFIGLIDSPIHWIFNHGDYVSIVISAADRLVVKENEEIFNEISDEISRFFPDFNSKNIKYYRILKEKRATIKSDNRNLSIRNILSSNFNNVFITGDWTNINLPATIESAVLSGKSLIQKI